MNIVSFKSFLHRSKLPYIHFKNLDHFNTILESYTIHEADNSWNIPEIKDKKWYTHSNDHLGPNAYQVDLKLNDEAPKFKVNEKKTIKQYTHQNGGSAKFNETLINPKKTISQEHHDIVTHLHGLVSKPFNHDMHLFSGVSSDPRKWDKEKDGSTRLRAFTSMTTDRHVARAFAHNKARRSDDQHDKKTDVHIIKLHVKAGDKGLPVSKHSIFKNEYESVLPADTHIKPHPELSEPEKYTDKQGRKMFVHHYVIHKQHAGDGSWKPENKVE